MRGKRSFEDQTRGRLLDLWVGEEKFGRPLGCVASTYTFDATLFEEQCLSRFLGIQSNPNESARSYLIEREEKLSQAFACVLVDHRHVVTARSLRWQLLPVVVGLGGAQHAKLSILAWENCVRVLIGSANLTHPGYRQNYEQVAALDFMDGEGPPRALLDECLDFAAAIASFAPGRERPDGPQPALRAFLKSVRALARVWKAAERDPADPAVSLIGLVPKDQKFGKPVLARLGSLWTGSLPSDAWVMSPFFDNGPDALPTAWEVAKVLTPRGQRRITYVGPGRKLADGTVHVSIPDSLKTRLHASLESEFGYVPEDSKHEKDTVLRSLHAKNVWLERDDMALYMLGSSNFTQAGMGLHPNHNIELNVVYQLDKRERFSKQCEAGLPNIEYLEREGDALFLAPDAISDDEGEVENPLPMAFGAAIFTVLTGTGPALELEIGSKAPTDFRIESLLKMPLLDSAQWAINKRPHTQVIPWGQPRPPSALTVNWKSANGEELSAPWIVNVASAQVLPDPDELQSLTLEELLEVLTSTRPLHESIMRVLERREKAKSQGGPELDPHRRVDTSGFLLQFMRRVSDALEGLRERMEQPFHTMDALRWRLFGPLGPMALATRLANARSEAAGFMTAEVATTLRAVRWSHGQAVARADVTAEVRAALQELRKLATQRTMPANLANFVEATFAEVLG